MIKIEGEAATKLAVIEAKLNELSERFEQEYELLQESLKQTVFEVCNVSKEDQDTSEFTLTSKYYPALGFMILEKHENMFTNPIQTTEDRKVH